MRQALLAKGYAEADLPKEPTRRDIRHRMHCRLKRIQQGKPLKKIKETDAIFANVQAGRPTGRDDPQTLEIASDTKAKMAGGITCGGKKPDGQGGAGSEGLGS